MKRNLILACLVTLAAGCAGPITKQDQQSLAQPINCATAPGDLRMLASEKANVGKEIENGVSSIVPIGLVVNTVAGTEKARFEVGTGEYNKMIDKKVAEIKAQCHL
jgi:hypothetical protein